jgi:tRNA(Ile)-lysidine synthase TilS/MesJ
METFEMRRESGSSPIGLAGMSRARTLYADMLPMSELPLHLFRHRIVLLRPILHFTKEYLKNFLLAMKIEWKNDPMNDQDIFRRVIHRKQIMSYDSGKLAEYANVIEHYGATRHEIETAAVRFLLNEMSCFFMESVPSITIDLRRFMLEKANVQAEILRRVIWDIGKKKYPPSIDEDVLQKIIDKKINTIGRCLIRINKMSIRIVRENRRRRQDDRHHTSLMHLASIPFVHNPNLLDVFL